MPRALEYPLVRFAIFVALVAIADAWFIARVLAATEGALCPTTDDAFIHLQYARSFAELRPLVYQPGEAPTTGATSLLFPILLAPGFWLGARGMAMVAVVHVVSCLALAGGMMAAYRLGERIFGRSVGFGAALAFVACPTFTLLAFGGMEVGVSAALYLAALAGAVLWVADASSRSGATAFRRACFVVLLGAFASVGRPEGLLAASITTLAIWIRPPKRSAGMARAIALLAPLPWFLPMLVELSTSGLPSTSGSLAKLLPANPYLPLNKVREVVTWNAENIFERILVGETVPGILRYRSLPRATLVLWSLGAIGLYGRLASRRGNDGRLAFGAWILGSAGIFAPLAYTWIGNMGRYVLAFAPIVAITASLGIAAIASSVAARFGVGERRRGAIEALVSLAIALAFVVQPSAALSEHAEAARQICAQQVRMAERVDELPEGSVVAVNDAGAITYLGDRRTFDLIGLTSPEAALPRLSGVGSVFERLERLPPEGRPTHAAIYPNWFHGFGLLGPELDRITVEGIYVGAYAKVLYRLDTTLYGSGELPLERIPGGQVVDTLDVADVDSERAHGYHRDTLRGASAVLHRYRHGGRTIADGGRRLEAFEGATLVAREGRPAVLVARVRAPLGARIEVRFNHHIEEVALPRGRAVREIAIEIPKDQVRAHNVLHRRVLEGRVDTLHDWLYQEDESDDARE